MILIASPLFDLYVKISTQGIDGVDKELAALEKRLADDEKRWGKAGDSLSRKTEDFSKQFKDIDEQFDEFGKKQEKRSKSWLDTLGKIGKSTKDLSKTFDSTFQSVSKGSDSSTKSLSKFSEVLGKIKGQTDELNKSGLGLTASLKGGDDVVKGLDAIAERLDRIKKGDTITLTAELKDGDTVIGQLDEIEGYQKRLNGSTITMTTTLEGGDDSVQKLKTLRDVSSELNGDTTTLTVDHSQVDDTNVLLDDTRENLSDLSQTTRLDIDSSDADHVNTVLDLTRDRKRELFDKTHKLDIDASAAEKLPTLLGDALTPLFEMKSVATAIAVTTLPALIAAAGAAGSAIAVAAAGVGGLTTALGAGLASAAAQAYGAVGLAEGSIYATGVAANAAVSTILGLGKGFGDLDAEAKAAEKSTKAFQELVDKMPPGTEAAAQAQERLGEAVEYQRKVTELQTEWWGKYGEAANTAAKSLDTLRFGILEIVTTTSGELIPTITEFVDIGVKLLPTVDQAFQVLTQGVKDGTQSVRDFLDTSQGFQDVQNLIFAVGRAAEPTFTIISNGAIVALQAIQPIIPASLELLNNLADLSSAAAKWAQSAEGMETIASIWERLRGYAEQLGEAVGNLGEAIYNLGRAFIESGIADQMMSGFVDMTRAIKDFTASAQDADSEFSQFLENAKPILTAAGQAAGELVKQILRVVSAISSATDSATGMNIMVEIFNGIREAAAPLGDLLISTFTDLGPIIADLIPNLAELAKIFLGSTPELVIFLSTVNSLISAFNALPDPVQAVVARITALSLLFGPMVGQVASIVTGLGGMVVQYGIMNGLLATLNAQMGTQITMFGLMSTGLRTAAGSFWAATAGARAFMVAIAPILAIGTIAILVAVYFDMDAAKAAYTQARSEGENVGGAFGAAVIAGLEAVPIVGRVVSWIDENIGKPIDNWLSQTDLGIDEWFSEQLQAADKQVATDSQTIRDTLSKAWEGAQEDAESKFGPVKDRLSEVLHKADDQLDTDSQTVRDTLGAAWDGAVTDADSRFGPVKDSLSKTLQDADTQLATDSETLRSHLATKWDEASSDAETRFKPVRDWITQYMQEAQENSEGSADDMDSRIGTAWESIKSNTSSAWSSVKGAVAAAVAEIVNDLTFGLIPAIETAIGWLGKLQSAAGAVERFLGIQPAALKVGNVAGSRDPVPQAKGGAYQKAPMPQGGTGGVADGLTPRVVYGEANSPEAYIVKDRSTEEQLPYLATAAGWHGYGLVPVDGMARGGVRRHRSRGGGGGDMGIGSTFNQVGHLSDYYRAQDRRAARQERRQSRRDARTSSTTPTSSTPTSPTSPTPTSSSPSTGATPTGASGGTPSGTASPSTQNFPASCGTAYPVASPTPSEQQPYTAAALAQSGMGTYAAAGYVGDHVNATLGGPPGDLCGTAQGGSVPSVYPSNPMGSPTTPTQPWQQCGPSFAMATGGTLPSNATGSQAHPVDYQEVPVGWWDSFLGYGWYGDPGLDWPTLYPDSAWDPSLVYQPASSTQMAQGGILRDGVRYFQGGGLNETQVQAGLDAGNSVLGSPYSYGSAGEDGGFDCAGIWNYIEAAVVYGAPQTGKRWGTYDAAVGLGGSFTTPGAIPGGVNIGVDLSGWGGPDDTHMAGDIAGTSFESDGYAGVHNGYDSSAFGTQYTMGSASDMVSQLPAGSVTDPLTAMQAQVAAWWACQHPPVPDIGSAPIYTGVENWMSTLPGMTEDYLQQVGQDSLGTVGGSSASQSTNPTDWVIAALEGAGLDASPEAIQTLTTLMDLESGGNPSLTGPNGELGLMQIMPDTYAAYSAGGDPYDPVANLIASINYQMARYGQLVAFSPYAKGGFAKEPHLGLIGEAGKEMVVPLEDRAMAQQARQTIGTEGMAEELARLRMEVREVTGAVRYQTDVMGERVGGGVDRRIASNPRTHKALGTWSERRARLENLRGG